MFWPCETRTSTCRSFATISSGLYRFLAIAVLLDVKDIPQVGPLQWGRISQLNPIQSNGVIKMVAIFDRPSAQCAQASIAQERFLGGLFSLYAQEPARKETVVAWAFGRVGRVGRGVKSVKRKLGETKGAQP